MPSFIRLSRYTEIKEFGLFNFLTNSANLTGLSFLIV